VLRVVLDVNVFVAAHISPSGAPARLLRAVDEGRARVIASPDLVAELDDVLHRPKFAARIDPAAADRTVLALRRTAEMHYPSSVVTPITRDSDDDYLVLLARLARADALVTGDRDLLDADIPETDVRIMTPSALLAVLDDTAPTA
jgi:putative PIN family toxin of toxin-antitoxin system